MDAFERVYAALEGKPVDRPPVFPQIGDHAGILAGLTYNVMYEDAEKAAQAHLDAQELYGYELSYTVSRVPLSKQLGKSFERRLSGKTGSTA
ncbi:MAG: hypothetical protein Fur0044_45690 [Anaerolineae bacterium]